MRDGTNEFVWICKVRFVVSFQRLALRRFTKAKKTVNSRDRELHGIWCVVLS